MKRGENCIIMPASAKLNDIVIELGWTAANSSPFEVDACCFLLTDEKKVRNDKDFIFYNQPASADGSVVLNSSPKDSLNNSEFCIFFAKIPAEIVRIVIAITIYQAEKRRQNFSMVENLYMKVTDKGLGGQQIACYEPRDANEDTTRILGNIYRAQEVWKFCAGGQGFKVGLAMLADKLGVDIQSEEDKATNAGAKRGRRSTAELLEESAQILQQKMSSFLPKINTAVEQKDNESKTRMILDRIFTDVFDYKIEEIKAEQKIQGRKADYVLSVDGIDVLVVEVKRAGSALRDKQIFQATSYGAYSGIRWAILTNLQTWQAYCVSTQNKVEADLIFSVDLSNEPTAEDFKNLLLISRDWISKKNTIEKLWNETRAFSRENIISSILSEDVINKIRSVINRDTGCTISNDKIQKSIEEILGKKREK
jgi:stress response protein SCP2/predicted type IV restriction endonuclease